MDILRTSFPYPLLLPGAFPAGFLLRITRKGVMKLMLNKIVFQMANWCRTDYVLYSDNKKNLETLHELLVGLENMEKPLLENGFGKSWLGCLVTALGEDWRNVWCKGEWDSVKFDGEKLTFSTNCIWYRCSEVDRLIQRKFPSVEIYFMAEDSLIDLYHKNDAEGRYFPENYVLDIPDDDVYYLVDHNQVVETMNRSFSKDFKTYEEALSFMDEFNDSPDRERDGEYISFEEIVLVEL